MKILVWVATPFTSGCPWKHINHAKGFITGDPAFPGRLIMHASKVCRLARLLGGHYMWEWLEKCDLWRDCRVKALTSGQRYFTPVSTSAVGWEAIQRDQVVTIRKRWELWIMDPVIASAFSLYQYDLNAGAKTFVECSGIIAKKPAHHTRKFAEIQQKSQFGACSSHGGFVAGRSAPSSA